MEPRSVSGTPQPARQVLDLVKQRRLLNKLMKDLIAFTGTAITDIASRPKAPRCQRKHRLLYRRATDLPEADLDVLIVEIGPDRLWWALDRYTQREPQLPASRVNPLQP
jgi:hypothetical protein